MNKKVIAGVVGGVVVAGAVFYGGMAYGKTQSAQSFGGGRFGGQFMVMGGAGGTAMRISGGATTGEIITKDSSTLTVKMPNGSSKIVIMSTSTQVLKSTEGSLGDLQVGALVTVIGSGNSDGSLTAQSVQIRPAGTGLPKQTR